MLRTIEMYTNEYKDTTQKEIRKKKGQFLYTGRGFNENGCCRK